MFCTKCGKELNPRDRFCANCGAEVKQGQSDHKYDNVVFNPPFRMEAEKRTAQIIRNREEFKGFKELADENNRRATRSKAKMDWNLEGFPESLTTKTTKSGFDWDSVIERRNSARSFGFEKPDFSSTMEHKKIDAETEEAAKAETAKQQEVSLGLPPEDGRVISLEELEKELYDLEEELRTDTARTAKYEPLKDEEIDNSEELDAYLDGISKTPKPQPQPKAETKEERPFASMKWNFAEPAKEKVKETSSMGLVWGIDPEELQARRKASKQAKKRAEMALESEEKKSDNSEPESETEPSIEHADVPEAAEPVNEHANDPVKELQAETSADNAAGSISYIKEDAVNGSPADAITNITEAALATEPKETAEPTIVTGSLVDNASKPVHEEVSDEYNDMIKNDEPEYLDKTRVFDQASLFAMINEEKSRIEAEKELSQNEAETASSNESTEPDAAETEIPENLSSENAIGVNDIPEVENAEADSKEAEDLGSEVFESEVSEGEKSEAASLEGEFTESESFEDEITEGENVEAGFNETEIIDVEASDGEIFETEYPEAGVHEYEFSEGDIPEDDNIVDGSVEVEEAETEISEGELPAAETPEGEGHEEVTSIPTFEVNDQPDNGSDIYNEPDDTSAEEIISEDTKSEESNKEDGNSDLDKILSKIYSMESEPQDILTEESISDDSDSEIIDEIITEESVEVFTEEPVQTSVRTAPIYQSDFVHPWERSEESAAVTSEMPDAAAAQTGNAGDDQQFYTFSKKNEAFQELLRKERERLESMGKDYAPINAESHPVSSESASSNPASASTAAAAVSSQSYAYKEDGRLVDEIVQPAETIVADLSGDAKPERMQFRYDFNNDIDWLSEIKAQTSVESLNRTKKRYSEIFSTPLTDEKTETDNNYERKSESEKKRAAEEINKIFDEDEKNKPKKHIVGNTIIIILVLLILFEGSVLAAKLLTPDSSYAHLTDGIIEKVMNLVSGNKGTESAVTDTQDITDSDIDAEAYYPSMVAELSANAATIGEIQYNDSLTYDSISDPAIEDIMDKEVLKDEDWTEGDDGEMRTYAEAVYEAVISYYDSWLSGNTDEDLVGINRLELGEIRQDDEGYYTLVRVTYADSDGGVSESLQTCYLTENDNYMSIEVIKKEAQ